jgi:hypothetical protein
VHAANGDHFGVKNSQPVLNGKVEW